MSKLFDFFRRERRAVTLRDPDGWRDMGLLGTRTSSGIVVGPDSALAHPAFLGAARLVAELTASLPILVYERTRAGKRRADNHRVFALLHERPNDLMTPFSLKETLALHVLTHGNGYLHVLRQDSLPVALWPLHPTRVSIDLQRRPIVYKVTTPQGQVIELPPADVVHVAILADDGITGRSPVQLAREAIGAALAAEEFAAEFFGNNATPAGVLTTPNALSPEAYQRLKESWNAAHGRGRRHGTAVLEQGTEFKPITSTAEAAQLVETRKLALRLIAAAMRIPAHLLDPEARGTYSNVETQSLEFLTFSLQPMLTRIEEALSRKLFTPAEQDRFFAEFLTDGLLRSDTSTRYGAYKTGIEARFLTPAEVRQRENLPALPPGNTGIAGDGRQDHRPVETRAGRTDAVHAEFVALLEPAIRRVVARETSELSTLVPKAHDREAAITGYFAGAAWMEEAVRDAYTRVVERAHKLAVAAVTGAVAAGKLAAPAVDLAALVEPAAAELIAGFVARHRGISQGRWLSAVRAAVDENALAEAITALVDEELATRAGKAAEVEAAAARNEVSLRTYRQAGVRRVAWVTSPGSCAFCRSLDGRTVGLDAPFVQGGEDLGGLVVSGPRVRPPLHEGCSCTLAIEG